jgi:hypothetical protein
LAADDEDEEDEDALGVGVEVELPEPEEVGDPDDVVGVPVGVVASGVELGEVAWAITGAAAAALRLEVDVW